MNGPADAKTTKFPLKRKETSSLSRRSGSPLVVEDASPKCNVILRVPNKERLAHILGDPEPPYCGVITGNAAKCVDTVPGMLDFQLFERFKPNLSHSRKSAKAFQIKSLHIGGRKISTWYSAPYPAEYSANSSVTVCEFCLKYMASDFVAERHNFKCQRSTPPGNEIYRDGELSVFEVDGAHAPLYCQNLCLLAKLFLDSKTLYYDVEPFLFYVLTRSDDKGAHFVGYFSKEKTFSGSTPETQPINNVSCIVTLPLPENKGYGQFLIEFSYLLSSRQLSLGSPEKPLSDLGLRSYTNYWLRLVCYACRDLLEKREPLVSIRELSSTTGMSIDDVIFALETLGWFTDGRIRIDVCELHQRIQEWESKGHPGVNPNCLAWAPSL